jgi:hypothetical protein
MTQCLPAENLQQRVLTMREAHHEMANALAVVSGYLEMLLADETIGDQHRAMLQDAFESAEHVRLMLRGAIHLTRSAAA